MTLHAKGGEFNITKSSEAQSKIRFEVTDTLNHVVNGYCTDRQYVSGLQYYLLQYYLLQYYLDYLVDLDTYKNQN